MFPTPAGTRKGVICLSAGLACLALTGCGESFGSVKGKVTYQGKNLKGGGVSFVSADGGPSAAGTIGEDGTYSVPKLTTGSYKVCVDNLSLKPPANYTPPRRAGGGKAGVKDVAPATTTGAPEGYTGSSMSMADAAIASNAKRYVEIPGKYAKPGETDLTFTVQRGDQSFDIELK